MNVEWGAVATVIAALLGFLGVLLRRARRPHLRDEIEQDQRILARLPKTSSGRAALQASVDARVGQLARSSDKRNDPFGMALAIVFVALAVLFGWLALQGGWWVAVWLLVAFFGTFSVVGFVESARRVPRDAQGARIKAES